MTTTHAVTVCPRFHRAVELIGKRWTGAILRGLMAGPARFNAIASAIPDMSDRMLSERLRELEHEGIITRVVYPETPVRVEYELTDKGRALDQTFCAIARWAETWVEAPASGATTPDETAVARHLAATAPTSDATGASAD